MKKRLLCLIGVLLLGLAAYYFYSPVPQAYEERQSAKVKRQSFDIDVRTVGDLEAAHSLAVASTVRGDSGKIIFLIPDGTHVEKGETLIKLDPTPFEEKLETVHSKIKEQEGFIEALKKSVDYEISQAEKDYKTAAFEIEAAELELNKVTHGDGPLEIARLKGAMQKALAKYEEFNGYSDDLLSLQEQGYLNPAEIKNAQKKLEEEREAFEAASQQYETFVNHVFPMQVKKGEANLKQARMKQTETNKIRGHAIEKAQVELELAYQNLETLNLQRNEAEKELALAEIKAPAPGMAVHREDYRSGQRRKPRIGDVTVRNQIIMELPDLSTMTVKSKVREVDLCKVDIGRKGTIEVDAYPQARFTGKIVSIGILALPDPGKPTEEKYFEIRLLLDKSDPKLRPGMTTRVTLHSSQVKEALTVPIHAVFHEQKKTHCYVLSGPHIEKREVQVGLSNEEWAEIQEGLNEGEEICLSMPQEAL